jgi:hypothetical protein
MAQTPRQHVTTACRMRMHAVPGSQQCSYVVSITDEGAAEEYPSIKVRQPGAC